MFTGIIVGIAKIIARSEIEKGIEFIISYPSELPKLKIGCSIAINGVCLTCTSVDEDSFTVQVIHETIKKTNLGNLQENHHVNLEPSATFGASIDGHIVQGHIDCTGEIIRYENDGAAVNIEIKLPEKYVKYIVNKGSITIDGMSITVVDTTKDSFTISLIPHTQQVTIAKQYQVGTVVNIETDILAKHVEKLIGANND